MNKWISVDDQLPKDEKLKVVRYCNKNNGRHLGIALTYYRKSQFSGKYGFDFDRGTQPTKVTHWFSLPNSPVD